MTALSNEVGRAHNIQYIFPLHMEKEATLLKDRKIGF